MLIRMVPIVLLLLATACGGGNVPVTDQEVEESPEPTSERIPTGVYVDEPVRQQLQQGTGGYFLVQFEGPLGADVRGVLEEAGVVLFDHVPSYAYYVFLPAESLTTLTQLVEDGTVRYVGPIPVTAKLEPALGQKMKEEPQRAFDVVVQFFEELSKVEQKELEQVVEVTAYSFGPVNLAEGTIASTDLEGLLSLPFVKWVEEQAPNDLGAGS